MRLAVAIFLLAFLILSYHMGKPFWGHHDYNNAFYGNMARNLVRYGPITTKLGQVTSLGITNPQDFSFHTHHPPLLIWLLGLSYAVFGVTEWATRLFPIIISSATVALFYLLIKNIFNQKTALAAVAFWLITPIFIFFGKMAVHEILVLFFFVLSLYFYWRGNFRLLLASLCLGYLSGWPAYYISPLIILIDFFQDRKFSTKYVITLLVLPIIFFLLLLGHNYILTGDAFGGGLLNAYFFRAGAVPVDYIHKELSWIIAYFSKPLVLVAILGVVFLAKRSILIIFALYGLAYLVLFKSAAYRHDYLIYYFLPFITASAGYFAAKIHRFAFVPIIIIAVLSSFRFTSALLSSDYMREGLTAGNMINKTVAINESVLVSDTDVYTNADWTTIFYGDRKIQIIPSGSEVGSYDWIVKRDVNGKLAISR